MSRPAPEERQEGPLWLRTGDGRTTAYTRALGDPAEVYGERTRVRSGRIYREWVPSRSKLGAALALGYRTVLPEPGERWLYLGAASGTTATHVADLVGSPGAVYAIERSVRPFARLLRIAERYPNLFPILDDARVPGDYLGFVPPVDGLYADIAQPDQLEIVLANARLMLRDRGAVVMALKTASMGRGRSTEEHLEHARSTLEPFVRLDRAFPLEPLHKRHYLLSGRARNELFLDGHGLARRAESTRSIGPRAGRSR